MAWGTLNAAANAEARPCWEIRMTTRIEKDALGEVPGAGAPAVGRADAASLDNFPIGVDRFAWGAR